MSLEHSIISYVFNETNGLISLTPNMALNIIRIIRNEKFNGVTGAKIQRFSGVSNQYEQIQTVSLTKQNIDALIHYALNVLPVEKFYRYELIEDGQFSGYIFTVNPLLHDVLLAKLQSENDKLSV